MRIGISLARGRDTFAGETNPESWRELLFSGLDGEGMSKLPERPRYKYVKAKITKHSGIKSQGAFGY